MKRNQMAIGLAVAIGGAVFWWSNASTATELPQFHDVDPQAERYFSIWNMPTRPDWSFALVPPSEHFDLTCLLVPPITKVRPPCPNPPLTRRSE